jgi:hypothetical protein
VFLHWHVQLSFRVSSSHSRWTNSSQSRHGLPHMGWRQSMRRSVKSRCKIANGLMYQIFKAIRYLATNASKKNENGLVITFEDCIPSLPKRYQLPKAELAEKWLYLERPLRQAYRTKPHAKALPFEITKRYFMQLESRSQVDNVLAEQAKLNLSKPHPLAQQGMRPGTNMLKS